MKKLNYLFMLLTLFFSVGAMTSCSDDDDEPQLDAADAVAGKYSGRLTYGTTLVEDAYVVEIHKETSSIVSVDADFMGDNDARYTVSKTGNTYTIQNELDPNISITVYGNSLTLTYLTVGGRMYSFTGVKD